ncbi:PilW family protein [Stutzerimonas azotifigens]|uniref:PilW family protein n=1 Tax=Stutzerimonas azotifigens TaxID=291995 RepID=UPI0003F969E9|nr:hypothetical protein [Stutzerimonas azotifigens]
MKRQPRTLAGELGLSMVELLVALAVSSFLILGITQVYIDNKRNYLFQQSQAGNQENARFLAMLMDSYLNKAGYRRAPHQLAEYAFPAASFSDCGSLDAGAAVTKAANKVGLCLRYYPMVSEELDCQGNKTAAFDDSDVFDSPGDPITLLLYFDADSGSLRCKNLGNNQAASELVTGITDFRLQFAVGKALNKTIDQVVAANAWGGGEAVLGVGYQALLAGGTRQRATEDSKVLDDWLKDADSTTETRLTAERQDLRLYQVASGTHTLRNLTP